MTKGKEMHLCWQCYTKLSRSIEVQAISNAKTKKEVCGNCGKERFGTLCRLSAVKK